MAHYRTFLFPEAAVLEHSIRLDKRESHHLMKVFRARVGDGVEVLDGKGRRYIGRLSGSDARAAVVAVDQVEVAPVPQHQVTLLQALPKSRAMDLTLRILTEIGVSTFQPVYTRQSEVHIPQERVDGKVGKWRATMIEASKQCGLVFLPEVLAPVAMEDWLAAKPAGADELRIVASLEAGSRLLLDTLYAAGVPKSIVLAVGPEGDFTSGEYAALRENGFVPVRLGDNVLRAETAAAYMLSVVDQFIRREKPLS